MPALLWQKMHNCFLRNSLLLLKVKFLGRKLQESGVKFGKNLFSLFSSTFICLIFSFPALSSKYISGIKSTQI